MVLVLVRVIGIGIDTADMLGDAIPAFDRSRGTRCTARVNLDAMMLKAGEIYRKRRARRTWAVAPCVVARRTCEPAPKNYDPSI
jgi:hypothetical protein